MTISDSDVSVLRPLCPLCRGDGVVLRGASLVPCPECARREMGSAEQDLPPCYGYASCSEECMALCPWAEGCKEASQP